MIFARVTGSVVCTQKDEKLVGSKLLLLQPVDLAGAPKGNPLVAVDSVGAGEGELVLVVQGSSARQTSRTEGRPVDAVIFAIVDSVEKDGKKVLTDGPFAETREQLGGYCLIDVKDLDEALKVATEMHGTTVASIEVRPLAAMAQ